MPELPDVEAFRARVATAVGGRRVERLEAPDREIIRNASAQGAGRALSGKRLATPWRHGKWLVLPAEGGSGLVWHFAMTGEPVVARHGDPRHPHDRFVLVLDEDELRLRMMRRLGGVWLLRRGTDLESVTGPLGPDATALDRARFRERLAGRRGSAKAALMDQTVLAGLGNLLVDEVCWRAGIHPRRRLADLDVDAVDRLHAALRKVLRASIKAGRVPPRPTWLTGARDADEPHCPRCGTALAHGTAAGRSTWWCPDCQPG